MKTQQTKKIIVDIVTVLLVAVVIGFGYWVFTKNDGGGTGEEAVVSTTDSYTYVVKIGIDIARTLEDLNDLRQSVVSSKSIFNTPAFKNLKDLSVVIPPEKIIKRENPFTAAAWKTRVGK